MTELGFWDDLETFENAITTGGTDSLFDHELFAAEALSPTASSASLSASTAFLDPTPSTLISVVASPPSAAPATASPAPTAPAAPSPASAAAVAFNSGATSGAFASGLPPVHLCSNSFLDNTHDPLRKRVKVTITAGTKRCSSSALGSGGAPAAAPTAKRARAGTLRFVGAGEAVQPRFNFDIRRKGANSFGGLVGKIGGPVSIGVAAKVGKKRAGKDAALVASKVANGGVAGQKNAHGKMMVRVAPAPRAKTLSGVAATVAVAAAARGAKLSSAAKDAGAKDGKGVSFCKASKTSKTPKAPKSSKASKASKLSALAPLPLSKRVSPTGIGAAPRAGGGPIPVVSSCTPLLSDGLKERLAALPAGSAPCGMASSAILPTVMPALEAVNTAASAYRFAVGDEEPAPIDDVDFFTRLFG